jgi:hypothetical protein
MYYTNLIIHNGMASLKFMVSGVLVDTGHPLLAGGTEPWNDELNLSNGLS